MMNSIPEGKMRDDALKRIERLDCGHSDKTLASCDRIAKPPRAVLAWQKKLRLAGVDYPAFARAVATELRNLVCVNDGDAIYILRGITSQHRFVWFAETRREGTALVDFIMSKDCPVSASLTDDDKSRLVTMRLMTIKRDEDEESAPRPTSNKEK